MSKKKGDYKVGYGRPPVEHQVKKGQILNPKGRGKGTKNLATDIREEAGKLVEVRENGRLIKLTKQRLLVKGVINDGLTGNARDKSIALTMIMKFGDQGGEEAVDDALQADEQELLELLLQRAMRRKGGTS